MEALHFALNIVILMVVSCLMLIWKCFVHFGKNLMSRGGVLVVKLRLHFVKDDLYVFCLY